LLDETKRMMPLAAQDDVDVARIEAARKGDVRAFEELIRRHGRWVRGVIFAVLGDGEQLDDVAQQVWTQAWERIGELRSPERWRGWLGRLARNAALDAGRRRSRERGMFRPIGASGPVLVDGRSPSGALLADEQHRVMHEAIRGLPAIYREPLVLRYLEGWNYRQIAEVLGLPVDTVQTRLVRARRLLREAVKDKL